MVAFQVEDSAQVKEAWVLGEGRAGVSRTPASGKARSPGRVGSSRRRREAALLVQSGACPEPQA